MLSQGAQAVLEHCFSRCAEQGWRLALALTGDPHLAFDAVQQAFVVAARKVDVIPAEPWPWFSTVVAHEARNIRRKRRPHTNGGEAIIMDTSSDPMLAAQRAEEREMLRRALDELPGHERDALVLTGLGGLTHTQAARALDLPVKTVSSRVSRGLQTLRNKLGAHSGLQALAATPLITPPGGWEAAVSAWKTSAFGAIATPTATAIAVQTGGLLAMNKSMLAACAAVVLCAGLAGGTLIGGATAQRTVRNEIELTRSGPDFSNLPDTGLPDRAAPDGTFTDPATIASLRARLDENLRGRQEDQRRIEALKHDIGLLKADRDSLAAHAADLDARLNPFLKDKAERGPVFTFGQGGKVSAVLEADWKKNADAISRLQKAVLALRVAIDRGETPTRSMQVEVQRQGDRFREYEFAVLDQLPTAARFNGEATHPITLANLVAVLLRQAGLPLTELQIEAVNQLGKDFETRFDALIKSYGPQALRARKLLDEYTLKGDFRDRVMALLSDEQRAMVADPAWHKVAGRDLLCPTLMLTHSSPVVTGSNLDEISAKLKGLLAKDYGVNADLLTPWLADWTRAVESACIPTSAVMAQAYTFDQGEIAGRATVALLTKLLEELPQTSETRARLLDDVRFFIPRVLLPASPK